MNKKFIWKTAASGCFPFSALAVTYILACLFILYPFPGKCQQFRHIGINEGLSSRHVYTIQKDHRGYMWFLTHKGIDRYDGRHMRTYRLADQERELGELTSYNRLHLDRSGEVWETDHKGRIFRYDAYSNSFILAFRLPDSPDMLPPPVTFSFIDTDNTIWLCRGDSVFLYSIDTGTTTGLACPFQDGITSIVQADSSSYFMGTEQGVRPILMENNVLSLSPCPVLESFREETNTMYYDGETGKLFIGTFRQGIHIYDTRTGKIIHADNTPKSGNVTRICPYGEDFLLFAIEEMGIYRMDKSTFQSDLFIGSKDKGCTGLNGSIITDFYADSDKRVWIADYPDGITLYSRDYRSYDRIRMGGDLGFRMNNKVNAIMTDHDNDLWFATDNGIGLFSVSTGKWHIFSDTAKNLSEKNIFNTLCEISPGIVWAGGYGPDLLLIDKKDFSGKFFNLPEYGSGKIYPDRYVRHMIKDRQGNIWLGGYHNVVCHNPQTGLNRYYRGVKSVTCLLERDDQTIWVGTKLGLFLLDKHSGRYRKLKLLPESCHINTLNADNEGNLYIGTNGSGLLVYNDRHKRMHHYCTSNSPLISDNIFTVLFSVNGNVIMSTEEGISSFIPTKKMFHNWTKDTELKNSFFIPRAGIVRRGGELLFGTSHGGLEFSGNLSPPERRIPRMRFRDFKVFYREMTLKDRDSPLESDIDSTKYLELANSQNTFSFRVSAIDYDSSSRIFYSWKLEGFYNRWSKPGHEDVISFTNLSPGKYTLHIRAISNEDNGNILEERSMEIVIRRPPWLGLWAIISYVLLLFLAILCFGRYLTLRREGKLSEEKIRFFIHATHELHTPITMIKAPLEDMEANGEAMSDKVKEYLHTALRNTDTLFRLTTNLIDLERTNIYDSDLRITENDPAPFFKGIVESFQAYAAVRNVQLSYNYDYTGPVLCFDREKMDSIIKNLVSNAIKYTEAEGSVTVSVSGTVHSWSVEVCDTGIGIPSNEQYRIFSYFFRASNTVNSKSTGSGVGLMLVKKFVKMHRGKIFWNSKEGAGTHIRIVFPGNKRSSRFHAVGRICPTSFPVCLTKRHPQAEVKMENLYQAKEGHYRLLVVEDNDELRSYLQRSLSGLYSILCCTNGKEALELVEDYQPDLVLSDVMMPEMDGNQLCRHIKRNIETSHIPVILLTALNSEKQILKGFQNGADDYITKPFSPDILRTVILNALAVRETLRRKYAGMEEAEKRNRVTIHDASMSLMPSDWKFMQAVNNNIESNLQNQGHNIDALCSSLCMSRTCFYNKIKALTGQSPSEYVRLVRLGHAARMLEEGVYNITEIAENTGFCDTKYFREVFKKYYKVSPSDYANTFKDKTHGR